MGGLKLETDVGSSRSYVGNRHWTRKQRMALSEELALQV
eukprot:CAMPEP_0194771144 /NCGR_PEP_ID=MMETSP0323_2-20130528/48422_1 /TAXON_ID=2866 ORGANISM="Crypthecodinium cohnii, Strain Seligo" /NCGR_SAMPLE_ID=MMETSP0323_2 /ASSEMBLY_ACC=CAM_ASM_000346 /LENGTH=38 /DNA_ID= /DNA_START= /DNA_END= /DNA_ORIENTATION=